MNQLENIRKVFAEKGYQGSELVSKNTFVNILIELRKKPFSQEISTQLWEQAKINPSGEATINDLCLVIDRALSILQNKAAECQDELHQLQLGRRQIENSSLELRQKSQKLQKINERIQASRQDLQEYVEDLQLITTTFGYGLRTNRPSSNSPLNTNSYLNRPGNKEGNESRQMQLLFYVVIIMAAIQVIVMYKKYDFLNLMVVGMALSIFILNYYDSTYLKLCSGLAGVSEITDIAWLFMYAGNFWSPPVLSEHSPSESGYMKLIVLLVILNIGAKSYLIYLLFKQKDIRQKQNFTFSPFQGINVSVVGDNNNIITNGCTGNLNGYL